VGVLSIGFGRVPCDAEIMIVTYERQMRDLGVMARGHPKASEEHVIVVALYRVQGECAVFFGPPHRLFNACRSQCTLLKERIDNIR
jgi:hypothetical protein